MNNKLMNYDVGSIWRKWDLHIHSPFSVLNHGDLGYGFDDANKDAIMDNYVRELFVRAINEQVFVIGITDYFMLEGYKEVKKIVSDKARMVKLFSSEIKSDAEYLDKINRICLLPNIEFRLELAISEKTDQGLRNSKYQIHVIFSDKISVDKIEQNFLHQLKYVAGISDGRKATHYLTKENFIDYGNSLISSSAGGRGSPLFVGINNACINLSDCTDLLNTPEFRNNYVIVLAEEDQPNQNWNDQLAGIRKTMYCSSNAIFSANPKTIKWGTDGASYELLKKNMPCVWGSDAHSFGKMFKPDYNRFTWIKADPTFDGLLMALNNPTNRIYIGEISNEQENEKGRKNQTLNSVSANLKNIKQNKSKVWFNFNLELNPFLISIIGNKGSGKSALSDIIGYTGNTSNYKYFSFLSNERFLNKKTKYGDLYSTKISFYDGSSIDKDILSNTYDSFLSESVKYLPQKYIEEICNDLNDTFQKEIDETIFSYVSPQEKGTSASLEDLIRNKTKSNLATLIEYRSNLEKINLDIRKLEEKSTEQYRRDVENKLKAQELKLISHINNQPLEVKKPSDELKHANSEIIAQLSLLSSNIDKQISINIDELTETNQQIAIIEDFKTHSDKVSSEVDLLNVEFLEISNKFKFNNTSYAKATFNNKELNEKYDALTSDKIIKSKLLDDSKVVLGLNAIPKDNFNDNEIIDYVSKIESLFDKKDALKMFINRLMADVSLEEQKYIEYNNNIKIWELTKQMIQGDIPNTIDGESVNKYRIEKNYLDTELKIELQKMYDLRIKNIINIYEEYQKIISKYELIYTPIQEKINKLVNSKVEKIEFKAILKVNKEVLKDKILSFIDARADGDFKGKSEAYNKVDNLISSTDFNCQESLVDLILTLLDKTSKDPNETKKILSNPNEFYNYISRLEYLNPAFSIMSNDKDLSELSPGERGIVLLVFYLALSKDSIPFIIDQPEDNLDNQSVFSRLVPVIIEAKKTRQIIVVTHNPNIAVACDSEQIIYCSLDKTSGEMKYSSGSIENPKIKKLILDVLEGTEPAFTKRKKTYF